VIRQIIQIDEEKCTGCGACVPGCPEGALQVIDGKARLIGELLCDGLGACIGRCPEDAINVEEREAEPYDEEKVMANLIPQGMNVLMAHLDHLEHGGAHEYLASAIDYIRHHQFDGRKEVLRAMAASRDGTSRESPAAAAAVQTPPPQSCPGSAARAIRPSAPPSGQPGEAPSELTHWPVQMHLINPAAPYFRESDLLLAADCTAFAMGGFHGKLLRGKTLTVACPKLDQGMETYLEKLVALIDEARVNTITVAIMQVPCCGGLVRLVQLATEQAQRKVPVKRSVVSVGGEVLSEEWV
jgi:NAD-dependent dihydropyrimidine dehydrogenase PreA subunit